MTRIIRVELCDECPHAAGSRSCRASQWCDEGGILRCRKFTDYPLIPDWCPLEQVAPDWRPPAIWCWRQVIRPMTKKAKPTGYTDTEIWWTCPKCGTKNFGIYYSHTSPCTGCGFEHPRAGEIGDSSEHDEMLRLNAIQEHKSRIARLQAIRDDRLCEARELADQIANEERELRALQLKSVRRSG